MCWLNGMDELLGWLFVILGFLLLVIDVGWVFVSMWW